MDPKKLFENKIWLCVYDHDKNCDNKQRLRISQLAAEYAQEFKIPGQFDAILEGEKGKPYFRDTKDLHFSISHSGKCWVCALGTARIGVDLQETKGHNNMEVAKRFFNKNEYEYLKNTSKEEFFDIWVAKESYVKYTGTGIADNFSNFSVIGSNKRFVEKLNGADIRFVPFDQGYRLCVCSERIVGVEVKRFFARAQNDR